MNNVLFTSDILYDTDYAILRMIQKSFKRDYFKDISFIENDYTLIDTLMNKITSNPLKYILKEEYIEDSDVLYNSLLSEEAEILVSLGRFTEVINLAQTYCFSKSINVTVLCRNQFEEQIIKSRINNCKIIINNDYNTDVESFDSIITRKYEMIDIFLPLFGKNIYIANLAYNMEPDSVRVPLISMTEKIKDSNNLFLLDIYNLEEPRG